MSSFLKHDVFGIFWSSDELKKNNNMQLGRYIGTNYSNRVMVYCNYAFSNHVLEKDGIAPIHWKICYIKSIALFRRINIVG